MSKFGTILADPPWEFSYWGEGDHRGGERHYPTQSLDWLKGMAVEGMAAPDATLFLWAVNRNLPGAFELMAAWGFEFKTLIVWVKMARAGVPRIGCGHHIRNCTEHLLIGTRGTVRAPEPANRPPDVIFNPRGAHSRKPEIQYDLAERYPGPYLELFARPNGGGLFPPRPGWTFFGNEITGNDIRHDLLSLVP